MTVLPAETLNLVAVPLPLRSDRQRREALPFAVEEHLAAPLDQTHVAFIRPLPDQRALAVAISRAGMEDALTSHPGQRLIPEVFALPVPEDDATWSTLRDGDRVLVRASDGTGFVASAAMLPMLWGQAGRPAVQNHGAALPAGIECSDHPPIDPDPAELSTDLRQGAYRPRQNLGRPLAALCAGVVLIGTLHIALAYGDLRAMRGLVLEQRAATTSLLADRIPQATIFDDPQVLYRQLTRASAGPVDAGPLRLLERASVALVSADDPVDVQRLVWSSDPATLTLQVQARGLDQLQQAEEALRQAGLTVSTGTATAGDGAATADMTLSEGGV